MLHIQHMHIAMFNLPLVFFIWIFINSISFIGIEHKIKNTGCQVKKLRDLLNQNIISYLCITNHIYKNQYS